MARLYSNGQLNAAGDILRNPNAASNKSLLEAADILTYWRTIHAPPINTFQATLRDKIKKIGIKQPIIAQRLKRAASIITKLNRFEDMKLARMQDIAGIRAVLTSITDVRLLETAYLESNFKHSRGGHKDYISTPQASGYRGIHLIYQYHNPKQPDSDGLRIELQFRTKLQHAWATTVETVGTFLGHSLKSSQGPQEWLEFFALVSAGFAIIERSPKPEGYAEMSDNQIFLKIIAEADRLNIEENLEYFSIAADGISQSKKHSKYNN